MRIRAKDLVGETLSNVDIFEDNEILLTTVSGKQIKIFHSQDCCESVTIEGTEGDWKELIGKVIKSVGEDIECGYDGCCDSWTKTALTFKVDGATVINRWFGESNGYYSESVDFEEIRIKK